MDDESIDQARQVSGALVEYAAQEIKRAAATRTVSGIAAQRIADGVKISKTSKIGEFSYGFASQRFSGGGNTQQNPVGEGGKGLLAGMEFGSNKWKQFPRRSPKQGRGSSGYFIFPTLRKIQPEIVRKWEAGFTDILKKWDD